MTSTISINELEFQHSPLPSSVDSIKSYSKNKTNRKWGGGQYIVAQLGS